MRTYLHKLGLVGTVLSFAIVSGSSALALPPQATAHAQSSTTTSSVQDTETSDQANAHKPTDPGSHGATKLADAKLKSCQHREKAITNILTRIADRGQKQITLFGTIATRTETFYTTKGKTLSNYDALVADVNTKAAVAKTAVSATSSTSSGFSCDGTDPKGFVSSFQVSLKSEIGALKDYRTSVKNLIVGVKSVQSITTTTDTKTTGGNQ
jgi:hypothetical protein